MRTVFHCDDIGMTPAITDRILEAWRSGMLDSFSVIANGTGLDEVSRGLREDANRDVLLSAHLNLSEGLPSARPDRVPLLLDEAGSLCCGWGLLMRQFATKPQSFHLALRVQIETEWRAQLDTIAAACAPRRLDCIDGHLHIHMLPPLFPIAANLAREFGISRIRILDEPFHISGNPSDSLSPQFTKNFLKHCLLRWCSRPAIRVARDMALDHFDSIIGILYTGRMTRAAAEAGIAAAEKRGAETLEVLFHIGRANSDEAGRWKNRPALGRFPLSELRDREFEELTSMRSLSHDRG